MQHDSEQVLTAFLGVATGAPPGPELLALRAQDPKAYERGLAAARALLRHAEAARFEAYPEDAVRRAMALLEPERDASPIRRLIAAFVPAPGLAPALRSGRAVAQSLYEADGYELDLALHPGVALIGQVVRADGEAVEGGTAILQAIDGELRHADLDPGGEFVFSDPPSAPFRIIVDLGSISIAVESFDPHGDSPDGDISVDR